MRNLLPGRGVGTFALLAIIWSFFVWPACGAERRIAPTAASTATSASGCLWAWSRPLPQGNSLVRVIWTGHLFVAIGPKGTIVTSPDGVTWLQQSSGTLEDLRSLAFNGTQLVAVGDTTVVTSPDGLTWTTQQLPNAAFLTCVVWAGSQFVAISNTGMASSVDGVDWTWSAANAASVLRTVFPKGMIWTGSMLLLVGEFFDGRGAILSSPDGAAWTSHESGISHGFWDIASSGSLFVAVAAFGSCAKST